jgi:hypothetical protein
MILRSRQIDSVANAPGRAFRCIELAFSSQPLPCLIALAKTAPAGFSYAFIPTAVSSTYLPQVGR